MLLKKYPYKDRYYNTSADINAVKGFGNAVFSGVSTTASFDGVVAKLNTSGSQQWIKKWVELLAIR